MSNQTKKKILPPAANVTPKKSSENATKKGARKARAGNRAPQKTTSTISAEIVEAEAASEASESPIEVQSHCIIDEKKSISKNSEPSYAPGGEVEGGPREVSEMSAPGDGRSKSDMGICYHCGFPAIFSAPHAPGPLCGAHLPLRRRGRQVSYDGDAWSSDLQSLELARARKTGGCR